MPNLNESLMFQIPDDVWSHKILPALNRKELTGLGLTCKKALAKTRSQSFWNNQTQKHFPNSDIPISNNMYQHFFSIYHSAYSGLSQRHKFFFYAVKNGDLLDYFAPNVIWLLDLVYLEDDNHISPLAWLIKTNQQSILNKLYAALLHLSQSLDSKLGWDLGHWAVVCNQSENVVLKEIGGRNYFGAKVTPLHLAAKYGLSQQVAYLLRVGLDARQIYIGSSKAEKKFDQLTALHLSVLYNHVATAKVLLQKGAQVDTYLSVLSSNGYSNRIMLTSLAATVIKSQNQMMRLLVEYRADPFLTTNLSPSAFRLALAQGNTTALNSFLNALGMHSTHNSHVLGLILQDCIEHQYYDYIDKLVTLGGYCDNAIGCLIEKDSLTNDDKLILTFLLTQSKHNVDITLVAKKQGNVAHIIIAPIMIIGLALSAISPVLEPSKIGTLLSMISLLFVGSIVFSLIQVVVLLRKREADKALLHELSKASNEAITNFRNLLRTKITIKKEDRSSTNSSVNHHLHIAMYQKFGLLKSVKVTSDQMKMMDNNYSNQFKA